MLKLVQSLAREGRSEDEIVAAVLERVNSGQVILVGNFRGVPLKCPGEEPTDAEHPNGAVGSTALGQRERRRGTDETPFASGVFQQTQDRTGR